MLSLSEDYIDYWIYLILISSTPRGFKLMGCFEKYFRYKMKCAMFFLYPE